MSVKATLIKMAIKMTPNRLIIWATNRMLKGIAELTKFRFDLDARQLYVQTRLYGEQDTIEICFEGFGVFNDGRSYRFILPRATSNRPWLNNLLSCIAGRAWQIPTTPSMTAQLELAAELLKVSPEVLEKGR